MKKIAYPEEQSNITWYECVQDIESPEGGSSGDGSREVAVDGWPGDGLQSLDLTGRCHVKLLNEVVQNHDGNDHTWNIECS